MPEHIAGSDYAKSLKVLEKCRSPTEPDDYNADINAAGMLALARNCLSQGLL